MIRRCTGRLIRQVQQRTFEQGLTPRLYGAGRAQPPASDQAADHERQQRSQADRTGPACTLAGLEAKFDVVLAAGHGHDPEQHVAAQDGRRLSVDGGDPARVVGVAQHQPRVGRSRGVDFDAVGGVAGDRGAARAAPIGRQAGRLGVSRRRPGSLPGRAGTAGGSSRSAPSPRLGATRALGHQERARQAPPCFRARGSRCRRRPGGTWSWCGRTAAARDRRRRRPRRRTARTRRVGRRGAHGQRRWQ